MRSTNQDQSRNRRTKWLTSAVLLAVIPLFSTVAQCKSGDGDISPLLSQHILKSIHAKPLSKIGNEVVRFSTDPAIGGPAIVVELSANNERYAEGHVTFLVGHHSHGWKKHGSLDIRLPREDFTWLTGEILHFINQKNAADLHENENICVDGPGYLTEYRFDGVSHWISGFCGDHANDLIAPLIARVVSYNTARYLRNLGGGAQNSFSHEDP